MPNDCWNTITIVCKDRPVPDELNELIINELQHRVNDLYVYNDNIELIKKGNLGIMFESSSSAQNPDYTWLEMLLTKYPNFWIKNEWYEEGGMAGVWVGFVKDNETIIRNFSWEDICIEGKHFLFI